MAFIIVQDTKGFSVKMPFINAKKLNTQIYTFVFLCIQTAHIKKSLRVLYIKHFCAKCSSREIGNMRNVTRLIQNLVLIDKRYPVILYRKEIRSEISGDDRIRWCHLKLSPFFMSYYFVFADTLSLMLQ